MPNFNNGYNFSPSNYNYGYNNFNQPQSNALNIYTYVKGLDGAKNYQIGANQTVLLIDSDNSVLYVKTANALGQVSLQCFNITPITEEEIGKTAPTTTQDWAAKSDVDALIKRVEILEFQRAHGTKGGGQVNNG